MNYRLFNTGFRSVIGIEAKSRQLYSCIFICQYGSLCGLRVEPDFLVSNHGSALGYCPHFQNPGNTSDEKYYRVDDSRGTAMMYCTVYYYATG